MKNLFTAGLFLSVVSLFGCAKTTPSENPGQGTTGSLTIRSKTDTGVILQNTRSVATDGFWLAVTGPGDYSLERTLSTETTIADLKPGDYTVTLVSEQNPVLPALNKPVYRASDTKEVTTGTKTIVELVCTQINAGVKFVLDESVTSYFADLRMHIEDTSDASKYIDYSMANAAESDKAYFDVPATLRISLKEGDTAVKIGGEDYVEIQAAAKELWTITLSTSSERPGSITMDIEVIEETTPHNPELGIGNVEGMGTAASPYSVTDAINVMPAQEVWVEGFITGSTTLTPRTRTTHAPTNILIGKHAAAKAGDCIVVVLPDGNELADLLNLADNPGNLSLKVMVKGDIAGKSELFTSEAIAVMSGLTEYNFVSTEPAKQTIKELAIPVGAVLNYESLTNEPAYASAVRTHFNMVSAENAFSPATIWKGAGEYDFTAADAVVDFAEKNNMKVHASALVWPDETPEWVSSYSGTELTNLLTGYVAAVVGRYKGKVASWDVVRNAFGDSVDETTGSYLKNSAWYTALSGNFIRTAFTIALTTDPDCTLFISDKGLEYSSNPNTARLEEIYDAIDTAQSRTTIHGISMLAAFGSSWTGATAAERLAPFTKAAEYGIVHLSGIGVDIAETEAQAGVYKSVFETYMCLPSDKIYGATVAAVTGSGVLLDSQYQTKAAYDALLELIETEDE